MILRNPVRSMLRHLAVNRRFRQIPYGFGAGLRLPANTPHFFSTALLNYP
jgi:hypothetical protein